METERAEGGARPSGNEPLQFVRGQACTSTQQPAANSQLGQQQPHTLFPGPLRVIEPPRGPLEPAKPGKASLKALSHLPAVDPRPRLVIASPCSSETPELAFRLQGMG
ncbi:hypothetical protein E8E14_002900 [Neopestalotiopsis sp. 37M]|nr:hypothetical protein E8E14_002900 [Neopestalotiopsis sp. 37M]